MMLIIAKTYLSSLLGRNTALGAAWNEKGEEGHVYISQGVFAL